jgi:hypothetical protein
MWLLHELGIDGRLASIAIERRVSIRRDLAALWSLCRLLRNNRFDLVHSMTPKAGLLGMAAAWMTRVLSGFIRSRVRWATRRGASRWFLRLCDVLVARMATETLADSFSQRAFLVGEGVASTSAMGVLGKGSVGGVDLATFKPDSAVRNAVRKRLGVQPEEVLLLFVGRLTRDKGVPIWRRYSGLSRMNSRTFVLSSSAPMRSRCGRRFRPPAGLTSIACSSSSRPIAPRISWPGRTCCACRVIGKG